jgi:CRP-like cAMP-binding protein
MHDSFKALIKIFENIYGFTVPEDIAKVIDSCFHEMNVKKNEVLIHIGTRQTKIFFVVSGLLRTYYLDAEGNDKTRFFLTEGTMCGAEGLLVDDCATACTEALEDCVLLYISYADFKNMLASYSMFKEMWIIFLEMSLKYKIKRENSLLMKSAAERYIDFKKDNPNLEKRVNQKYIASYLGITPVSLSRIRRIIKDIN